MREGPNSPVQVRHPLEVLEDIEEEASRSTEQLLYAAPAPWAELLTQYVDTLNELVAHKDEFTSPAETHTLDEGHAGGCG
ncbi:DUF6269 family protein [Streptomyces griseus]|uniref:Uncharacterized protein n=1 Tax=Streptomyces griseus subsp. griseus (strain JCM 4626 / CBS 651.72 / NBRC 13350 / KCC S-0626 / ISP 5235) TaxID=455632 RepID=B1VL77_STRGG|nr:MULTISPECIES: DUF6269 family protein [Streptomyces]KUJ68207.1 hypothetical protein ACZ90_21215 [Streptomyces albus subsp. albus]MYR14748.1 hypothetical protein [Streptomyces sp. SID724]MYR50904.1 hypothetical protein [Streptomyces sp. SID4928]MYT79194.1 hypothetical protein [Streptomyces sp. SID8364]EGE42863.1 hypothetical protein SACT1_3527 [Streptomyces sp. ACT-1]